MSGLNHVLVGVRHIQADGLSVAWNADGLVCDAQFLTLDHAKPKFVDQCVVTSGSGSVILSGARLHAFIDCRVLLHGFGSVFLGQHFGGHMR